MQIKTKFFGSREIEQTDIIKFKHGIPGFESYRNYVVLSYQEGSPFMIMQSVEDAELALVLINLELVVPGYAIDLNPDDVSDLELTTPEDTVTYAIVVIPEELADATVNLAAPVVINQKHRLGKQILLNNSGFSLKHPLFTRESKELQASAAK